MDDDRHVRDEDEPFVPLVSEADLVARLITETADHAKSLIAAGFLRRSPGWVRAWSEYHLELPDGDSGYVIIPRDQLESFARAAQEDREVYDLAMYFCRTRILHGRTIPEPLRPLVAERLTTDRAGPAGARGRSRNWARDHIIIDCMEFVMDQRRHGLEFAPTCRRDIKGVRERRVSASEIVAEALRRTEIGHMDVQRIQKIWADEEAQANYKEARSIHILSNFEREDDPEWV